MARAVLTQDLTNIANILGTTKNLSALATGNVNKYARYKAVQSSKTTALTEEEFAAINYGLTVSGQTIYEGGKSITQIMQPAWNITYNIPTGTRRLSDWGGYAPTATFPIRPFTSTAVKAMSDGKISVYFATTPNPAGSVPMQAYVQAVNFNKYYLGIMAQNNNNSVVTTVLYSLSGMFNDNFEFLKTGITFKMPVTGSYLDNKNWTFYLCLFNELVHNSSDAEMGIFGSQIAQLQPSIKWLPFPNTETLINIQKATFSDYITVSGWSASPYSSNGRYYARVTFRAIAAAGTETVSISGKIAGVTKNASSYTVNGSTISIDVSITAAVYNAMIQSPSNYSYSLTFNITGKGVSQTFGGSFTSR